MATTIITKNGSGAPADGDLSVGELAVDLTNKQLYTKNSGGVIPLGGSGDAGQWEVNGNDIYYDDGNVGIGTASPARNLTIGGSSASTSSLQLTNATTGTTTSDGFQILQYTSGAVQLWNYENNYTAFGTNSTERMRIDSSGNVLIGKTSASIANTGVEIRQTQAPISTFDGVCLYLNRENTDGTLIEFRKDNTTVGSIGTDGGDFTVGTGTASTERMRIDANGNVGIGTSDPANNSLTIQRSGNARLRLAQEGVRSWDVQAKESSLTFHDASANATGGLERMRIDSNGNVGINTDAPEAKLHIRDSLPSIIFDDQGFATRKARLQSQDGNLDIEADYNNSTGNSRITFRVDNDEKMRIHSSGELLVNTTASSGTKLTVKGVSTANVATFSSGTTSNVNVGMIVFRDGASEVCGQITSNASTNTVSYNTSSDERLKENIADADDAGNKIDAIKVRKFDWIKSGLHQDYGMVAQELVEVAPEAVTQGETEDDMWSVDYSKLVPMMIKEIQDLKAKVAELESS